MIEFVVAHKLAIKWRRDIRDIYPNVASASIERIKSIRSGAELNAIQASLRYGGLWLKDWFQCDYRKQQNYEREDYLRVKVNAHGIPPIDAHHSKSQ